MKKLLALLSLSSISLLAQVTKHEDHNQACPCNESHDVLHYAPAGVMGAHIHQKGEWMIGTRSMFMEMDGLRDGTNRVSNNKAHGDYMAVPKDMKMQMHMLDIMYGLNDDWTLTLMIPWVRYSMNLNRRMTMGGNTTNTNFKTRNEGLGDIKLGSIYRAYDNGSDQVLLGLTLNLPTADVDAESNTPMGDNTRLGYPMQIGSGTWDLIPSVVYNKFYSNWSWGTKLEAILHTGENSEGYRRGDKLTSNLWASRALNPVFALNSRIEFNAWEDYRGDDDKLKPMSGMNPVADADLRAGKNGSVFAGFTWKTCEKSRVQFEAGVPVYQEIDGPNLETDYTVNINFLYSF
ncbi:transporter [Lentisphaera profundi]|uniref:Transporter n=1 Tax=Lentisphaera profundi TaxID=1658616 RepID=A0ABY7VU58_9BACT|nr:transporter [Lentisphaera profundi]WDE95653.1 transporter [Lentisphaera profundi]